MHLVSDTSVYVTHMTPVGRRNVEPNPRTFSLHAGRSVLLHAKGAEAHFPIFSKNSPCLRSSLSSVFRQRLKHKRPICVHARCGFSNHETHEKFLYSVDYKFYLIYSTKSLQLSCHLGILWFQ